MLAGLTKFGKGSTACCLDAAGVAAASGVLRRALQQDQALPDVLVVYRLGQLEYEGTGLRQEMAAAVEAGEPLITAVDQRFMAEWQDFRGGLGGSCQQRVLDQIQQLRDG